MFTDNKGDLGFCKVLSNSLNQIKIEAIKKSLSTLITLGRANEIAAVNICSHLREKHMKPNIKETCVSTVGSAYIMEIPSWLVSLDRTSIY